MSNQNQDDAMAAAHAAERARSIIELLGNPDAWDGLRPEQLPGVAFSLYVHYGATRDPGMHPQVRKMHALLLRRLPIEARLRLQQFIAEYIEETGNTSELALLPFILGESSAQIIATTVLEYAMVMEGHESVDMPGPAFLIDQYQSAGLPDPTRLGILAGLILLGDERLLPFVLGRWSDFEATEHRQYLLNTKSGFVSTLQIEFLVDWLESTDDEEELASIAGALCSLALNSLDGSVSRIKRTFPYSRDTQSDPVQVIERWGFAKYAEDFLADRLTPLIKRELEPKVLARVLEIWSGL